MCLGGILLDKDSNASNILSLLCLFTLRVALWRSISSMITTPWWMKISTAFYKSHTKRLIFYNVKQRTLKVAAGIKYTHLCMQHATKHCKAIHEKALWNNYEYQKAVTSRTSYSSSIQIFNEFYGMLLCTKIHWHFLMYTNVS